MKFFSYIFILAFSIATLALGGCADEAWLKEDTKYTSLTLRLNLSEDGATTSPQLQRTRAGFDNFDNETDKWWIKGENIEELRILILDSKGYVEANSKVDASNATVMGEYTFKVRSNEEKTVLLIANEGNYLIDEPGMEISRATTSLSRYLESLEIGTPTKLQELKSLVLSREPNSGIAENTLQTPTLKTPLPITAIYDETIGDEEEVSRTYWLHRAAVKYSFRIINESNTPHRLDGIRIDRISDRQFLFPNADYSINQYGHIEVSEYRTPDGTQESEEDITLSSALNLPSRMENAVEALPSFYVPEGKAGTEAQKVSVTLDGVPLAIWGDLKWLMPGETEATPRDMVDLPRNTHVVVNITIKDNTRIECIACVAPYSVVDLPPYFGLGRDPDGNIITKYYDDGTYEVIIDNNKVIKDADNDVVIKKFSDGTFYCETVVKKDYIHGSDEKDYSFIFEKDYTGGNMIILRRESKGGQYHSGENHDHSLSDYPTFVLAKDGIFYKVSYDNTYTLNRKRTLSEFDSDSTDECPVRIMQVNGYQWLIKDENGSASAGVELMRKYSGTYIVEYPVINSNGEKEIMEELRWCDDTYPGGRIVDWEKGAPDGIPVEAQKTTRSASSKKNKEIVRQLKEANRLFMRWWKK